MIEHDKLLIGLPKVLRSALLLSFREISANYIEHRWEASELNGGKLCEVAYTILHGALSGEFASAPAKPSNMVEACRALEKMKADPARIGDRSLRVLIPRLLPVLYEIRNNRGVGHVGGDVDPNLLDATAVYSMSSWILAELIRIFHEVTTEEAQEAVDALMERKHPLVWEIEEIKRILDPRMSPKNQALLFLHQHPSWVQVADLFNWIEYSTISNFRSRILKPLHTERAIEYDREKERARISPLGIKNVETEILKSRELAANHATSKPKCATVRKRKVR